MNGFWTWTTTPVAEHRVAVREVEMQTRTSLSNSTGRALRCMLLERLAGAYGFRSTTAQRAVSLARWFASIQ